ncbi:flagellar FlbT [Desulfosarcina ovata subsp. sediminis]|uniref:Flagellar FlbT n=1 Tax=Desulfosarcina ovata subsp. sediminis TaxID=885957 RepID=A0A5K7ZIJ4_9BACT|nr:flagellar biosynthesis repressor FlbT [Desulfosarcina ovata]BBO79787.1 flagellar FlbT [Desulfosarcina ovata subsp. sediminis]
MGLKITLKPGERMIIDGAVITNGDAKSMFIVENRVPILRQKDIIKEEAANSPARRIYFVIQLMYIDQEQHAQYHPRYWELVKEFVQAAPSSTKLVNEISEQILKDQYYQALKLTQKLIRYETEILEHVQKSTLSIPGR